MLCVSSFTRCSRRATCIILSYSKMSLLQLKVGADRQDAQNKTCTAEYQPLRISFSEGVYSGEEISVLRSFLHQK